MTFFQLKKNISNACIMEYALIVISSVLLGIWAVKNTIALRNILLATGFLVSFGYLYSSHRRKLFKGIQFKNWIPLLFLSLMLLWVFVHYCFFSQYPLIQLHELKSTWFRAFLTIIVGVSTGIVLQKHNKSMNLLWLGIGLSFLYLVFQYIPRMYDSKNLYVIDWYGGYYIYIGKINGVLMGSILFCGLGSNWIDALRSRSLPMSFTNTALPLFAIFLTFYAYVFIFDTLNGLGVSAILILIWVLYACVWFLSQDDFKRVVLRFKGVLALLIFVIGLFSWFALQQARHNSGWLTLIDDAKVAVQVERYTHWQNPAKFGYPKTEDGRGVAGNIYERVSWATVGVRLIPENIFGVGILAKPFMMLLQKKYPDTTPASTHSAWLEFTLAFGLPGFIFMFGSLISILYLTITAPNTYFKVSVISFCLMLLLLYTVGELSTQHGVEVLFYLVAFSTGLRLPLNSKPIS